jgi:hypothetical protein
MSKSKSALTEEDLKNCTTRSKFILGHSKMSRENDRYFMFKYLNYFHNIVTFTEYKNYWKTNPEDILPELVTLTRIRRLLRCHYPNGVVGKKAKGVKPRVEELLEEFEGCRNSDTYLVWKYFKVHYPKIKSFEDYALWDGDFPLPAIETIPRTRFDFQKDGFYLARPTVAEGRSKEEKNYRKELPDLTTEVKTKFHTF